MSHSSGMSDAEKLATVQNILNERRRSPEQTIRDIREVLKPPPKPPTPIEKDSGGWPVMRACILEGSSWEYHDDPEMTR